MLYEDITAKILEAAFEISSELGIGFLESVYRNALVIALHEKGLFAECEVPMRVKFRDQVIGVFSADMLVNHVILVELKAVGGLLPEHKSQVINYLKVSGLEIGLLINFGRSRVEYHRLEHPNLRQAIPPLRRNSD